MELNILGTKYDFQGSEAREDVRLTDIDGYCDYTTKKIRYENNYNKNDPVGIDDYEVITKATKRHEIVHAFLFESGLSDLSENEMVVEWIAVQFPKMLKVFNHVGAL